ncbi:hypothetical protein D3C72_954280 [compost metagenome]
MRHQQAVGGHAISQTRAHKHAGQEAAVGVREHRAQRDGTGALVYRDFRELKLAGLLVLRAIFQGQRDQRGLFAVGLLQLAAGQGVLQAQQLHAGLGHVDVDRVNLLHRRQGAGLVGRDQRAFGHRRAADDAFNGRQHLGVDEVDARGIQRGLGRQHIGGGLVTRRHGVVVGLLADGARGHQRLVAFGQQGGRLLLRLGAGQRGLLAIDASLVQRGVDLIELLAGFDLAAFGEQALLHNAVHLGPHFGHAERGRAARQFGGQGNRLRGQGHHGNLRFARLRRVLFLAASGQGESRCRQREHCRAAPHSAFLIHRYSRFPTKKEPASRLR